MAKDALIAHARDELGISEITTARPVQAALTSAATFSVGAAMPLLMVVISPAGAVVPIVSAASLGFLALLGAIGARAGGANVLRATARVTFWGALAMALTAGIGKVFANSCLTTEPSSDRVGLRQTLEKPRRNSTRTSSRTKPKKKTLSAMFLMKHWEPPRVLERKRRKDYMVLLPRRTDHLPNLTTH